MSNPNGIAVRDGPQPVAARADGVELLGQPTGSGYRRPPSLVRRNDGQVIQLTPLLFQVLSAIDGRRGHPEIARVVGVQIDKHVTSDDVRFLIEKKLRPLGVLRLADGSEPAVKKTNPLLGLRWRMVLSNPKLTGRVVAPFTKLFLPQIVFPILVAFVLASAWVLMDKGLASAMRQALYEPGLLLLIFGLTMLSTGFHEVGHAAACRYGGAKPGTMGVGLYLVWPAFYTDVTDSYRLGRGARIRVDLGGLYFNAIFAVATVGLWAATGWDALLLVIPAQLFQMLRQLVPLVRFDGYHVLADLTGVPDLFAHIKPILLNLLPTRWRKRDAKVLKPWVGAVVTLWVLIVIPVLTFSLVMMAIVLPRIAATAWDSLGLQWEALNANLADGKVPEVGIGLIAMFTIALPLLGMSYLIARVVRRMTIRTWRATAGRPLLRIMAALAGAVGLALLAWAWWPDGQYRPIQPHERGALTDVGFAAQPPGDRLVLPGTQAVGFAETAPAAMADLGPSAQPRLALVLSPQAAGPGSESTVLLPPSDTDSGASSESGWVFPFNPPPEMGEGDNRALAVNTEDGSSLYDVSFALVWVTDGSVDEINDAWALASCRDCRTVAVAFQAVFVIGGADVVVPQNIAVAANYDCTRCQTFALAKQFVATLSQAPSADAMRKLALIEQQLKELAANIEDIPLNQLQTELASIEAEILEILVQDNGAVPTDSGLAQDSGSGAAILGTSSGEPGAVTATSETPSGDDATPAPSEEPTSSPSEEPTSSPEPTPSPSEEPTPSQEPTPAPSEEPSPAPTP